MLSRPPGSEGTDGGYVARPKWGPLSEPAIPSFHTTSTHLCSILEHELPANDFSVYSVRLWSRSYLMPVVHPPFLLKGILRSFSEPSIPKSENPPPSGIPSASNTQREP